MKVQIMTRTRKSIEHGRLFLQLGLDYLKIASNILGENLKAGNKHVVISDYEIIEESYGIETQWSDFNIIVPTLFNFYHGLELVLKGLLSIITKDKTNYTHDITLLFNEINSDSVTVKLYETLKRHLKEPGINEILSGFLKTNGLSISQLYEALRYPEGRNLQKVYEYGKMYYLEGTALPYFAGAAAAGCAPGEKYCRKRYRNQPGALHQPKVPPPFGDR